MQPVAGFAILLSLVAIGLLLMLVVAGYFPPLSRPFQTALFTLAWFLLVAAGTFCRDILVILITLPLLLGSLLISAVLWRSTGTFRKRAAATLCYWAGVLMIATAVFH